MPQADSSFLVQANVENDLLSKDGDCNGQKIVLHKV